MCLHQWEPGTGCSPWDPFCRPLVTFSLFAVVSVLLRLLCRSGLLLVLPFLRVFRAGGRRVRPQGDDHTSHVVTAGPVSRCVRGQTVVQQLSGEHVHIQEEAEWLQKTTDAGNPDATHLLRRGEHGYIYSKETVWTGQKPQVYIYYQAVMSLTHLFYDGWERSHMATFIGLDPLADEVHHFLTAQHVPAGAHQQPEHASAIQTLMKPTEEEDDPDRSFNLTQNV